MEVDLRPKWSDYYFSIAYVAAQRSPDAQTKVGGVLVNKDNQIISIGYNGFTRGCLDINFPNTRPDKYPYVHHCELNLLINSIERVKGSKCYTTCEPCHKCLQTLVHAGVYHFNWPKNPLAAPNCVDEKDREIKKFFLAQVREPIEFRAIEYDPKIILEISALFLAQTAKNSV